MENLTCEQCNKSWKRQPSRGRKPRLCPQCLAAPQSNSQPVPAKQPKIKLDHSSVEEYKFPGPTKWLCKTCGTSIKTEINLQYEPTHACQKRLRRVFALELIRA